MTTSNTTPDEKKASETPRTDAQYYNLFEQMRIFEGLTKADNLKLYWLFHQAIKPWLNTQESELARDILHEIENRFIPEYDGEAINMTETGWVTPNGPINYL